MKRKARRKEPSKHTIQKLMNNNEEKAIEQIKFDPGKSSRSDTKANRETLKKTSVTDQWYQNQQTDQEE